MHTNDLPTLIFADLLHSELHAREDADGATITIDPMEEAAFDVVLDVDARCLSAAEWTALETAASDPRFAAALAALCHPQANEARRIGGQHGR